ncbi:hypothetical protein DMUE_5265 [Dictyocoela muelleri]|nr:hypothetical protein DMUE_5265 [Dictyocoela muelleri]
MVFYNKIYYRLTSFISGVSEKLCLKHKVVNHNNEFISLYVTHINNIERFWSHLKGTMRKEPGVMRKKIDYYLEEYSVKNRFLMKSDNYESFIIFKNILKLYLN